MGETTPRQWGSLVASEAAQPANYMAPSIPPIDGPSSGGLAIVWGSRLPLHDSVEIQAGVLLLGPLWVLGRVIPRS